MDKLPINERVNLSTRMHAAIYIGVIKEFFKDTWEITFRVPLVIDNLDQYPRAVPLFHHEYELFSNDEVIIFVTTQADPTQCYYMPITLYKFIGLKHGINFVDITKDGIIDLETNNFYSFSIENSEHRTLKTRTDVSNKHQTDANDVIINIPIDPDTQQDIIPNRGEPVVESKDIGSRVTNIKGPDTVNHTGDKTVNHTGYEKIVHKGDLDYERTGNEKITRKGDLNYNITGKETIVHEDTVNITQKGNLTYKNIEGDIICTLENGGSSIKTTKDIVIDSDTKVHIKAPTQIQLESSEIFLNGEVKYKPSGDDGPEIKLSNQVFTNNKNVHNFTGIIRTPIKFIYISTVNKIYNDSDSNRYSGAILFNGYENTTNINAYMCNEAYNGYSNNRFNYTLHTNFNTVLTPIPEILEYKLFINGYLIATSLVKLGYFTRSGYYNVAINSVTNLFNTNDNIMSLSTTASHYNSVITSLSNNLYGYGIARFYSNGSTKLDLTGQFKYNSYNGGTGLDQEVGSNKIIWFNSDDNHSDINEKRYFYIKSNAGGQVNLGSSGNSLKPSLN